MVAGPDGLSLVPYTGGPLTIGGELSKLASNIALGRDSANIIVRSGFHCAQPAHEELSLGPTVRASFGIYNTPPKST